MGKKDKKKSSKGDSGKKKKKESPAEKRRRFTGYDYSVIFACLLCAISVGLLIGALQGSEWWHIKREFTEVWTGLGKTCYNWRGSYDCVTTEYQDFVTEECDAKGEDVKSRHGTVMMMFALSLAMSAVTFLLSLAILVKFRFKPAVVKAATAFAVLGLLFGVTGVGIFYQTQTSFAFCKDYCEYASGPCVSQTGKSFRMGIAAACMGFLTMLFIIFKNFDPRVGTDEEEEENSDSDGELFDVGIPLDSTASRITTKARGGRKAAPPTARTTRDPDEVSDADTEPTYAVETTKSRSRAATVTKNPIPKAMNEPYDEEEADNEDGSGGNDDGAEVENDYVWDEEMGLYWSDTWGMHVDVDSGHFYDAQSGYWYDPESEEYYVWDQ